MEDQPLARRDVRKMVHWGARYEWKDSWRNWVVSSMRERRHHPSYTNGQEMIHGVAIHQPSHIGDHPLTPMFMIGFVFRHGVMGIISDLTRWVGPEDMQTSFCTLTKPYLVETIRQGVVIGRLEGDNRWQEAWIDFSRRQWNENPETRTRQRLFTSPENVHHPNGHSAISLFEFFDTVALVRFKDESFMACFKTGSSYLHGGSQCKCRGGVCQCP